MTPILNIQLIQQTIYLRKHVINKFNKVANKKSFTQIYDEICSLNN